MFLAQDFKPPGLEEARKVQAEIRRLGVQDVELHWDNEFKVWCVVQVRKRTNTFVTTDQVRGSDVEPFLLWYCQSDNDGTYRAPNQNDVNNVIATVRSSHHWFNKGADALSREVEGRDEKRDQKKEARLKERLQPHLKSLKRAIREELG